VTRSSGHRNRLARSLPLRSLGERSHRERRRSCAISSRNADWDCRED
jgi:hypothetical protein